jgi:hypothetical protein
MSFQKTLQQRILSLIGILLVAIGIDGLLSPEIFVYNSPLLGGTIPFTSPETVSQIINIASWPFYVPLFIGCVLVALDAYYYFTKNKVRIG